MKNTEQWKPSKFIYKNGKLRASRNSKEVSVPSRLVADIVASHYDKYLKHHVKGRLVDLGSGKVPLYLSYKNYASDLICVDWESSFHKNPYLDHTCNLNEPLPFKSEEFNTIILSDVLEHVAKPELLWREMYRILGEGGKVILNVPFFYKVHEVPHDYFRYTRYALQKFADDLGFKTIVLEETGGVPEILTDITSKIAFHIPLIGKSLAIFFQSMCTILMRTRIGKKMSSKTSLHFPLGYFMVIEK